MPTITYIQPDNSRVTVQVAKGQSVKDGAVGSFVPGILAECGGACACATCHVYIDEAWWDTVGGPNEIESEMLDFAYNVKATSRLSCQIVVTDQLHGLVVYVPETQ